MLKCARQVSCFGLYPPSETLPVGSQAFGLNHRDPGEGVPIQETVGRPPTPGSPCPGSKSPGVAMTAMGHVVESAAAR